MAIYEIQSDHITTMKPTSFDKAGLQERKDLQRLLKQQIDIICPNAMVIAEEFGEWEDSKRRIDLLAVDGDANLVVIELKRTDDGGHMDLQAIRYAAMVSAMTFERAVDIYGRYLKSCNDERDPRHVLLKFLNWDEPDEDSFGQDTRLVLASAEFSKELTTSVLWLNERGIDIRCVRIKPYTDGHRIFIDVQQLIPLPEAEEYQVKIREKQQKERQAQKQSRDTTKFDVTVADQTFARLPKRHAIFKIVKHLCNSGVDPEDIKTAISWRSTLFVECDAEVTAPEFLSRLERQSANGGQSVDPNRLFIDERELIHANGRTYALTNQWGKRTDEAISRLLDLFPDHGVSCQETKISAGYQTDIALE